MTPETKFKIKVMKNLQEIPSSWWEKIAQKVTVGTPDILGCVGKYFVAIELKRSEREKPDPVQAVKLYRISKCGSLALEMNPENYAECLAKIKGLADLQSLYKNYSPVKPQG